MRTAQQTLDATYLEMRWRCLALAADLDRVQRAPGAEAIFYADRRLVGLRKAIQILLDSKATRAEQVQMLLSDLSPGPNEPLNSAKS